MAPKWPKRVPREPPERAAKPKTKKARLTQRYRFFLFLTGLHGFTTNYDKCYRFTKHRVLVVAAVVAAAAAAAGKPLFLTGLHGFTTNYDKRYRFTKHRVLVMAAVVSSGVAAAAAAAAAAGEPQNRASPSLGSPVDLWVTGWLPVRWGKNACPTLTFPWSSWL